MVRKQITPRRDTITRQATLRLVVSLGLFVIVLGYSSYKLYTVTLQKAAHERAENLETFYRSRLMQVDRDWELQARDLKARIEDTHPTLDRNAGVSDLQAYLTVHDVSQRIQYLVIENRQGSKLITFGANLGLSGIPISDALDNGWYHPNDNNGLYRVFVMPIWLGKAGMGRMAVFFEINNALLFSLTAPGIVLTARHDGRPFASSAGQMSLDRENLPSPLMETAELRDISWSGNDNDETYLVISAPVRTLFTKTELVIGAAAIPVIDGLILWFVLGFWLMRNARRIMALGGAVEQFTAQRESTPELISKLDTAKDDHSDEIGDVAVALKDMLEQTVQRDRERQEEESQRRLWSMVFASTNEAILVTDRDNNILTANVGFTR